MEEIKKMTKEEVLDNIIERISKAEAIIGYLESKVRNNLDYLGDAKSELEGEKNRLKFLKEAYVDVLQAINNPKPPDTCG